MAQGLKLSRENVKHSDTLQMLSVFSVQGLADDNNNNGSNNPHCCAVRRGRSGALSLISMAALAQCKNYGNAFGPV